jgi:hypothetical protein
LNVLAGKLGSYLNKADACLDVDAMTGKEAAITLRQMQVPVRAYELFLFVGEVSMISLANDGVSAGLTRTS